MSMVWRGRVGSQESICEVLVGVWLMSGYGSTYPMCCRIESGVWRHDGCRVTIEARSAILAQKRGLASWHFATGFF